MIAPKLLEPILLDFVALKKYFIQYLPPISLLVAIVLWNWQVTGHYSISVLVVLFGLLMVSLVAGELFFKHVIGSSNRLDNFSTRILCGFFISNIALLILALILPFGLALDSLLLSIVVYILWALSKRTKLKSFMDGSSIPESMFIVIALVAVTFWCQDMVNPIEKTLREITFFKFHWDFTYHIRQISLFAQGHGARSISDILMDGARLEPYHLGSYIFPAVITALTSISSLESFASFQVPFGLLLTAVAAYSLLSSSFGKWPGFAAGLTLLLGPDALQQGFGNGILSYDSSIQVSPSMPYGVALAALAFLFMFEGCRTRNFHLVGISYFLAACTLIFKIHIFIAISFVILVYPSFFMAEMKTKQRWVYLLVTTGMYAGVILFSNNFSTLPTLQLDGTGLFSYEKFLLKYQSPGILYSLFSGWLSQAQDVWAISAIVFALMLVVLTFGVFFAIYLCLFFRLKGAIHPAVLFFPILITINYLMMSECLAPMNTNFGHSEEFLHRPFVWAYFVVSTWTGASLYYVIFGNGKPKRSISRIFIALVICLAIYIPVHFGEDIQVRRGLNTTYVPVPTCLMQIAQYIRDNSSENDIVQDSKNDQRFILTGFSERQAFAIDSQGYRFPSGIKERLQQLQGFKNMTSNSEINEFAEQSGIDWYVLEPGDKVMWPNENEHWALYRCGNYITYHFI